MDLYIYDRQEGLLDVIDAAVSIRWRRRYFQPGEVEIHLPVTAQRTALLAPGRVIRRTDRREAAIIEGVEIDDTDLAVTGRMLSSLLDRAILSGRRRLQGTPEQVMLELCDEGARVIPELATEEHGLAGEIIEFQASYKNLLTVQERVARAAGLGFRVLFQPGQMTFEVYAGVDRSVLQQDRPVVIFSDEFGNLANPKYTSTVAGYKNKAYVAGAGEGGDRTVVEVDLSQGEEVRELYVDARDLQPEEGTTEAEYHQILYQRGLEKLAQCVPVENFEGDGAAVGNFEYMTDWDLGDIVTIQHTHMGITMHQRITEVEEVYEGGAAVFTPVFGTPLPDKLDLGDDSE